MNQNRNSGDIARWREGIALDDAWYAFAETDARVSFAAATTKGGIEARRMMMIVDLWARLGSGELLAFGDRVAPTVSNGPVALPSDTFFDPPPAEVKKQGVIEVAGWRYVRVRVWAPGTAAAESEKAADVSGDERHARGRPDTYPQSKQVLDALYATESNRILSAEKLHQAFKIEFKNLFPSETYQLPIPSVRTLRDKITRYRQERARINPAT